MTQDTKISKSGDPPPWGHKVTMHVYVPGDELAALNVSDALCEAVNADGFPTIGFVGVTLTKVDKRPYDQGGS